VLQKVIKNQNFVVKFGNYLITHSILSKSIQFTTSNTVQMTEKDRFFSTFFLLVFLLFIERLLKLVIDTGVQSEMKSGCIAISFEKIILFCI